MRANVLEAITALREKPIFSTFYERVELSNQLKNLYADQPVAIRYGKILHEFLSRVSIPLEKNDLFVGRIVTKELSSEEERTYQDFLRDRDSIYRTVFCGHGHCSFDWENLADNGLSGVMAQIDARIAREADKEKTDYLEGMKLTLKAVSSFIARYARKAESEGNRELASVLDNITLNKPGSFYEALQLLWIVTFIDCSYITGNPTLTVGRLDRILQPYYDADVKSGALTRARAKELITDYYCKHNLNMGRGEHQIGTAENSTTFNRILNFDAPQYLLLAGTDENRRGVVTELTQLFAECIVPEFKNPVVVVHYFKDMYRDYPELWKTLSDKALASASLMFYNDDDVKSALYEQGLPSDVVNGYIHYGCNWLGLGLNSYVIYMGPHSDRMCASLGKEEYSKAGYDLNELRCNTFGGLSGDFMTVMKQFAENGAPKSIDGFFDKFFEQFDKFTDRRLKKLETEIQMRYRCPRSVLLFGDCFNRYTIESAACSGSSGVKWHFDSQGLHGFATAVDCFLAVDEICYRKKAATVSELYEAAMADFEGYPMLLALARKAEKFGNDTDRSNEFAARVLNGIADILKKYNKEYIERGIVMLPTVQNDTWHIKYGTKFGATPDGRRAFTPFSQNTHPSNGAAKNGLTAMLRAVNSLPLNRFVSGAFHFDVEPKAFEGEKGAADFSSLLGSYLDAGGLHAQVSSVNMNELTDAQENPDSHRDLRVRVTGYSGIFVDMPKIIQDDIIERMK